MFIVDLEIGHHYQILGVLVLFFLGDAFHVLEDEISNSRNDA